MKHGVELCHMKGSDRVYHNWRIANVPYKYQDEERDMDWSVDSYPVWYCTACRLVEEIDEYESLAAS